MAAVMADNAVATPCVLVDMPRPPMFEVGALAILEADTVDLFAVGVANILRGAPTALGATQGAHLTRLAAVTGEVAVTGKVAVTGEVVVTGEAATGIRGMDIQGTAWAIMDWVTAIRTTDTAITVTVPVGGTIRITHIILTDTDTRPI